MLIPCGNTHDVFMEGEVKYENKISHIISIWNKKKRKNSERMGEK